MSWRRASIVGTVALVLGSAQDARAQCTECGCSLGTTGLSFGVYNPRRPVTNSVGVVQVNCTGVTGYLIKLSSGGSGTATLRALSSGGDILNYNLYKDGSRTMIWGDGANGQTGLAGSGTANYNVYGGVFGGQSASVGSYVDSIVITVEY